jgi:hypothetical protein
MLRNKFYSNFVVVYDIPVCLFLICGGLFNLENTSAWFILLNHEHGLGGGTLVENLRNLKQGKVTASRHTLNIRYRNFL